MTEARSHSLCISDLRRASLSAALATAILQVSQFLVLVLLCRSLSPEEVGLYRQIMVLQAVPTTLLSLGLPEVFLYQSARAATVASRHVISRAVALQACFLVPVHIVASAGLTWMMGQSLDLPALQRAAGFAGILGGANSCLLLTAAWFLTSARAGAFFAFAVFYLCMSFTLMWALLQFDARLNTALAASSLAACLAAIITMIPFFRYSSSVSWVKLWKEQIVPGVSYGWGIALGSFLYLLGYQMDHLIAWLHFTPGEYALYAAGAWQLPLGLLVHHAQATTLMPLMANSSQQSQHSAFWGAWLGLVRPTAMLGVFVFWGVFFCSEDLILLLLGGNYKGSDAVFRCYCLALPLRAAAVYLPLRATGKTRAEPIAGLLLGLVSLVLGAILVRHFGLIGPALGMVAGLIAWNAMLLLVTSRTMKVPVADFFPLGLYLGLLSALGLSAWIAYQLAAPISKAHTLMRMGLFGVFYGGMTGLLLLGHFLRSRRIRECGP